MVISLKFQLTSYSKLLADNKLLQKYESSSFQSLSLTETTI